MVSVHRVTAETRNVANGWYTIGSTTSVDKDWAGSFTRSKWRLDGRKCFTRQRATAPTHYATHFVGNSGMQRLSDFFIVDIEGVRNFLPILPSKYSCKREKCGAMRSEHAALHTPPAARSRCGSSAAALCLSGAPAVGPPCHPGATQRALRRMTPLRNTAGTYLRRLELHND